MSRSFHPLLGRSSRKSSVYGGGGGTLHTSHNASLSKSVMFELDETSPLTISSVGGTLPVLVAEELANSQSHGGLSARFFNGNWIALVIGRNLFVWCYGQSGTKKNPLCRQLPLPVCDITHRADLIHLVRNEGSANVGCLAVSHDGVVRYWTSIHREDSFNQMVIACLRGEQCAFLEPCFHGVFLLGSKTGTILIIDTRTPDEGLAYRVVGRSGGFLSGLGRKFCSILTIGQSGAASGKLDRIRTRQHPTKPDFCEVVVLLDNQLQILTVSPTLDEKHENSLNVGPPLQDQIARHNLTTEAYNLAVRVLDVGMRGDKLLFLVVATNSRETDPEKNFILAVYDRPSEKFESSVTLAIPPVTQPDLASHSFSHASDASLALATSGLSVQRDYQLLLPGTENDLYPCLLTAVCAPDCLRMIQVQTGQQSAKLKFLAEDLIGLGSGPGDAILLFTRTHEILSLGHPQIGSGLTSSASSRVESRLCSIFQSPSPCGSSQVPQGSGDARFQMDSLPGDLSSALENAARVYWMGYKAQARKAAEEVIALSKKSMSTSQVITSKQSESISLDLAVLQLARSIMDEKPLHDPRWSKAFPQETNRFQFSGSSLLQIQQLQDKSAALARLQEFLVFTGIASHLSGLPIASVANICLPGVLGVGRDGSSMLGDQGEMTSEVESVESPWMTLALLSQQKEMVDVMTVICQIYTREPCIVFDPVVKNMVGSRGFDPRIFESLRHIDIFYQEISMLPTFLKDLESSWTEVVQEWDLKSSQNRSQSNRLQDILGIGRYLGKMIVTCLRDATKTRDQLIASLQADPNSLHLLERLLIPCWITSSWPAGIRDHLINICSNLVLMGEQGDSECVSRCAELSTLVLHLNQIRVQCAKKSVTINPQVVTPALVNKMEEEFVQMRQALITSFATRLNRLDQAFKLAERFADFELLVRLSDETEDRERLRRYMHQFADDGFPQYVMGWYVRQGKRGQLHYLLASTATPSAVTSTTRHRPTAVTGTNRNQMSTDLLQLLEGDETRDISWLHHVQTKDFEKAYENLLDLASLEKDAVGKRKTLFSLSKLALLSTHDSTDRDTRIRLQDIDDNLNIIKYQENLPNGVMEATLGLPSGPLAPVLPPGQLARLYLAPAVASDTEGEEIREVGLVDYLTSLSLLDQVDDMDEKEQLQLDIWSRAIAANEWTYGENSNPIDAFKETLFYLLLELLLSEGRSVDLCLPPLDKLIEHHELESLRDNSNFQFLIRAGLEMIERSLTVHH